MRTVLSSWWLDAKLGLRVLRKHPALTLAGAFGIAVGVALAAGGFSIIYGNFLPAALPLDDGHRIVSLELWDAASSRSERRVLRDYLVWREQLESVQPLGAFRNLTLTLIVPGAPSSAVRVASISASGFQVARVRPLLGRYLLEEDELPGAPPVVAISETVWRTRFGADPNILGRTLQLGSTPHAVVGVLPSRFAFPINHQFWIPLPLAAALPEPLTGPGLMVFGKLAPGVPHSAAQAELAAVSRRAGLDFPEHLCPPPAATAALRLSVPRTARVSGCQWPPPDAGHHLCFAGADLP
jgi:hypothetical protein